MQEVSPVQLMKQLQETPDNAGLSVNRNNLVAVAKLLVEGKVKVEPGEIGLRVRLAGRMKD